MRRSLERMVAFLAHASYLRRGAVLALALLCAGCSPGASPRPNVLLYVVDTLRRDGLGTYGNERASTPRIDAFAREGVVFEQASSPSSWTRASIATLLTGVDPPAHGAIDRRAALPHDLPTLAERLRAHGYATAFVTSNPNVGSFFGFDRGFDDVVELYGRRRVGRVRTEELVTPADEVVAAALGWLERAPRPFLLVVLCIDPHSPYSPPREYDRFAGPNAATDVDGSQASLQRRHLTAAQKERIKSLYDGEVAFSDAAFGVLLDQLRARGVLDDTLVILTADHGEEFWEHGVRGHGVSLKEAAIRIPLIIRFPRGARIAAGRRVDPAGLDDVVPTTLDLLGLPSDAALHGRALFDGTSPSPTFATLSLDGHAFASAREPAWKLVWDLAEDHASLYNLVTDPLERSPVSPEASLEAREAHARLSDAIARGLAARRAGPGVDPGALSPDLEASLRALGYLDD